MNKWFTHIFNIIVGILIVIEGSVYIFMNNKDGELHLRSIIMTILLLVAWGMSYRKQLISENSSAWLIVTIIILIPMILPWLFFI
ncbi:hypothetical protein SAMN05192559_105296 [Halobacillus karajensis]|uniref:Uncharacterized protein n=1 Tax=Halobacillus karajensis TaxID=195088 RepID=A0A024P4W9_9BACI|nr:hypothetical protein [Halobacillus karajensis]CDQ20442.1 hypothetical protein BN982_02783 [Halobacillus karajensis]CDQ24089.1 hypothetical protein BN983_02354 [Halobacillus karajensis]CDQ27567.1 hypothetical protein BN981_01835 [Halobacillus karajensis]SEH91607.1 hypothetical protein SAMN05192559_105296 [Halobacillus karajensis]